MNNELIISVYGSHNAAVAMFYKDKWTVIEVERWLNSKNSGLTYYLPCKEPQIVFDEICDYLLSTIDKSVVDTFITAYAQVTPKFEYNKLINIDHHESHAAAAFYQSPYEKCLIFTYDGGGDNGFFNVYMADRKNGIKLLEKFNQDLGFPYMVLAEHMKDIKKEPLNIGNLNYSGKLMGLVSYGRIHDDWVPFFDEFYTKFNYIGNSYVGGAEVRHEAVTTLFSKLGIEDFDIETSRYDGQLEWDIAATSQKSFENQFFKFAQPYLDKYPDLPVGLSGGCALNVLLNSKILRLRNNKVYVPPNTNDCGLAVGAILAYLKPKEQVDLTYSGVPLLDKSEFSRYLQTHDLIVHDSVTVQELAKYLAQNKIVGLIQGNSEHGSRALGNRSIICNPVGDMKQVLNDKVKHREWYRPFAPMVRLDDCSKYFEFDEGVESRHMTYVATVRESWRKELPAITHEDNTARLQTVTREQNELVYDLLGEMETEVGHGVLLNTSFNVNGKPILSRLSDAFDILRNSQMDAIYYEGRLIVKVGDDFRKVVKKVVPLSEGITTHILSFVDTAVGIARDVKMIKELMKVRDKIIITIPAYNYKKYKVSILESDNVKYDLIGPDKHYYDFRIKSRFDLKNPTTTMYSQYLKLFWLRESIKENVYGTTDHLCIDLNELNDNHKLMASLDKLLDDDKFTHHNAETIIATISKSIRSKCFTLKELKTKYNYVSDALPSTALLYGNTENMIWLGNNYEAMFLWFMDNGKIGSENDYLLMSVADSPYKYSFMEI